ncbi:MAG: GNAT family N-acetyltransferase [Cytophagaceae bacterium]|jgi:putative acetyltransferase|nr:GNAT family N-acetyltransferase [Cytophagaceae bacterium]
MLNLRIAELADIPLIQQLFEQSIDGNCQKEYSKEQIEAWKDAGKDAEKWKFKIKESFFLLAEENGQLLGFASLCFPNYLDTLYVSPLHIRKKAGTLLLNKILEHTILAKQDHLYADVSETALPFFLAHGFEIEKRNHFHIHSVSIHNYRMKKNLIKFLLNNKEQ